MNRKQTLLFLALAALFSLTACSATPPAFTGEWRIVSYGPEGSLIPAVAGVDTSVNFQADGKINGNAGCNQFFGTYTVDGETIEFSAIGSTMMACLDGRMEQEQGVLAVLSGEASYALSGNSLIITSAEGALLVVLEKK